MPGWDRDGAIAALRRARDLEPDNELYRRNLAVALERNDEGRLHGEGADLEGALEEWRHLHEMGVSVGDLNLLQGLAHIRRFEELEERSRAMEATPQVQAMLLVAVAAREGAESAVQEARSWDPEPRRQALGMAATELMKLRRWSEAADLMSRAAEGSGRQAALLDMVDRLRRTRHYEGVELDPDDPESILRYLTVALFDPDEADLERLQEQVPGLGEDLARQDLEVLREEMESTLQGEIDPRAAIDMTVSWMEMVRQDREGVGVRLKVQMVDPAAGGRAVHLGSTYFAERDGRLHWVSTGDDGELRSVDWYVVGRMAERYGEVAAARAAYRRVEGPETTEEEQDLLLSTWRLAQRRLQALDRSTPEDPGEGGEAGS